MSKDRVEIFRLWLTNHPRQRRRARGMTLAQLRDLAKSQGLELGPDDLRAAMDARDSDFFGPPERPLFLERLLTPWGLVLILAALLGGFLVRDHGEAVRRNQEQINPAAVEAMARIQDQCRLEGDVTVLRQCQGVEAGPACRLFGEEIACVLERRYEVLAGLGYALPPLYVPGYEPRLPRWQYILGLFQSP